MSGAVGQRFSKKMSLSVIYLGRALVIVALLMAPSSALTIYLFAAAMGLLWLSTVPLTTGIVAQIFGLKYMATLFGIVFLGHQIGSFVGIWMGGGALRSHRLVRPDVVGRRVLGGCPRPSSTWPSTRSRSPVSRWMRVECSRAPPAALRRSRGP